jgi:2-phospho-L-lactate transferase/gluconeogenesis factor (CofD/UPF0052 family)
MYASRAVKIFICNIVTQSGETDTYTCYDHIRGLEKHVGERLFDVILCNDNYTGNISPSSHWVRADEKTLADPRSFCADLLDMENPTRHDSLKLAQVIMDTFYLRTAPWGKMDLSM